MINVTLVGTGGMVPLPNRFLSSCLIEYNGKYILIDCGEGTQISLHKQRISVSKIDVILLTHLHADHVAGLPGLLLTIGNNSRNEPINIICPRGGAKIINSLLVVCGFLPYEVVLEELHDSKSMSFERVGLNIKSIPLNHHINCVGYSFELKLKPHFKPEIAKELNIPVKFWRELHSGNSIVIENKTITPQMVTGDDRKSIKISYVTDTRPVPIIGEIAKDSDLFICEGMYGDDDQYENAKEKKHMLFSEACKIAKSSNVSELWLTHFSPALNRPEEYLSFAKMIFQNTYIGYDGLQKNLSRD